MVDQRNNGDDMRACKVNINMVRGREEWMKGIRVIDPTRVWQR